MLDDYYNYYTTRAVANGRTRALKLARGNARTGADYLNALQRGRALAFRYGDTRTATALEHLFRELQRPEN